MNAGVRSQGSQRNYWAWVPVGILSAMLLGWGLMLRAALNDPSFGVEPDYYEKAVHFDDRRALERESAELGWSLTLSTASEGNGCRLEIELADRAGRPIEGAELFASGFHLARSSDVREVRFAAHGAGKYTAELGAARPGLWEFRVQAARGHEVFVRSLRRDLGSVR